MKTTFKNDTNKFFKKIVKNYINDNKNDYMKKYFLRPYYQEPLFIEWEIILSDIADEIFVEEAIDKGQDEKDIEYPYDINIIKDFIDPNKHTITLFVLNMREHYDPPLYLKRSYQPLHLLQIVLTVNLSKTVMGVSTTIKSRIVGFE